MQIIKRGAEAILYLDELDGEKVLVKERVAKKYRIKNIDEKILKTRTRSELKLLNEARKCGVNTPKVLLSDEGRSKIFMEFIDGKRMKEFFETADNEEISKICEGIGRSIGKLHDANIIHGDLTTSNMVIKDGKIFFIDFGLGSFSKRLEDKGVDIHLLHTVLKSTHFKILKPCWDNIIKGYKLKYDKAEEVLEKIKEIEKRARYMER